MGDRGKGTRGQFSVYIICIRFPSPGRQPAACVPAAVAEEGLPCRRVKGCPACGQREALEAFGMAPDKIEELVTEMQRKSAVVQAEIDAGRDPRELDLSKV